MQTTPAVPQSKRGAPWPPGTSLCSYTQKQLLDARRATRATRRDAETMPRPLKVSKMQLWHGLWMLVPGAAVYAYMKPSQNEEALAAQLRANYARNVRDAKARSAATCSATSTA